MTPRPCSVDGCSNNARARGWCSTHWLRWRKYGDVTVNRRYDKRPVENRISPDLRTFDGVLARDLKARPGHERVAVRLLNDLKPGPAGCWEWQGYRDPAGYGRCSSVGGTHLVHRRLFIALVRDLAEDDVLDHLCRNPCCANPSHLEPVTHLENCLRGISGPAQNFRKTHCKRGHAFTPANTWINQKTGGRQCRTCNMLRQRATKLRAARKAAGLPLLPEAS